VGMQSYAPACSGTGSCSCAETCSKTPQTFWRYSPACCGCSGATSSALGNIGGHAAPSWCASVPAAQRINVLPCADMGQCQCSSFCSASPATSWGYNPLCCGCSGAQVPSLPTTPSAGSSDPSWCSSIPEDQQHLVASCTSGGACQCLDECKAAPAFTWRFNPTCCGCSTSTEPVSASGGLAPAPAGLGCSCSSYCSMAPSSLWQANPLCCGCTAPSPGTSAAPAPAPVSGGSIESPVAGCSCSGLCSLTPSSLWRYNPLCCGCSGSGDQ